MYIFRDIIIVSNVTNVKNNTKKEKVEIMKEYGYARISTGKQSIERQERNILQMFPNAFIIKEVYTGTTSERKEWKKLKGVLSEGDTIIFDSVSRMSRNAEEGYKEYVELFKKGINLIFIKEPHINTEVYKNAINNTVQLTGTTVDFILEGINKYLLSLAKEQIKLAFEQSEKEVKDLQQRTKEGILTAKLNGKQIGNKKGTTLTTKKSIKSKELIIKYSKEFNGNLSDEEVMTLTNLSRNTYYKYKRELKAICK